MISKLFITGFRGMIDQHIDIANRCAIIGANGSGKTHILEAVHLASGGHLHYFHAPRDDSYTLELYISSPIGPKSYSVMRNEGREEYRIQGGKLSAIKYREDLPYRTVFLSPFDMNLLYFAPSVRRDYIDSILSRAYAQFPKVKREYEQVMRQRNALLKKIRDGEASKQNLDFWDKSFAQKAAIYTQYRMKFIEFITTHLTLLTQFLPKYRLEFFYDAKTQGVSDVEAFIVTYLVDNRDRDIITGHTHIGPHLDDFHFRMSLHSEVVGVRSENPHSKILKDEFLEATLILSRGETKVLLLALKQIEILFLKHQLNLPIVLLFDDIFAELDQNYAEHVIAIFDVDQVIVTTQRSLPVSEKWEDFSCIKLNLQ